MTTRRTSRTTSRTVGSAVLAALVLGLTACASGAAADSASGGDEQTTTVVDETGREIELELPVERAVSGLGGNQYILETVRAIGAEDRIVGASASQVRTEGWGPYWDSFTALQDDSTLIAGESGDFDYDKIIELAPEVLLTGSNSPWQEAEQKLAPFGIEVIVFSAWEPRFAEQNIALLGQLFGVEDQATAYLDFIAEIKAKVEAGLAGVPDDQKRRVYFEGSVDYQAGVPGGWDWVIQYAGGENVFSDIIINGGLGWNSYDVEPAEIVQRNPDFIIKNGVPSLPQGFYEPWSTAQFEQTDSDLKNRPGFATIDAVTRNDVYITNNFLISAASKWVGVLYLATWLYPEQFDGVDPEPYFQRYVEEFQGVEYISADDYIYRAGA